MFEIKQQPYGSSRGPLYYQIDATGKGVCSVCEKELTFATACGHCLMYMCYTHLVDYPKLALNTCRDCHEGDL